MFHVHLRRMCICGHWLECSINVSHVKLAVSVIEVHSVLIFCLLPFCLLIVLSITEKRILRWPMHIAYLAVSSCTNSSQSLFHVFCKIFYLYLSLAVLDLCCCLGFFPSCSEQRPLSSGSPRASHRGAFSRCRAWVLGTRGLQWLWLPRSRAQAP